MIPIRTLFRQQPRNQLQFQKRCIYSSLQTRPRLTLSTIPTLSKRNVSSDPGEEELKLTGHITTGPNEGILFFDNIFPLRLSWLTRIPFIDPSSIINAYRRANAPHIALADPTGIVGRALPAGVPLKVLSIQPRIREGGAYVKFSHDPDITSQELEGTVKGYLREKPITPWFNPFQKVRVFLVKGKPWIEDLQRLPSGRIKIEFLPTSPEASPAELTQETLYSLFRRYGPITEMTTQPSDSKIVPRFAYIDYGQIRAATMAKNCMHGFVLVEGEGGGKTGTLLRIGYEPRARTKWFRDWLTSHPRIVIPIIAALLAAASVAVFDPIRTWSIRLHITHGMHLDENKYYQWVVKQLNRGYDYIRFGSKRNEDAGLSAIWDDRHKQVEHLRTWLSESTDTFIVVQGPRGAGKMHFVEQALQHEPYKLIIDCKRLREGRSDSAVINNAAKEVGYRPVFSWMNSISSMIDLAAMGTIGTKTGFSETLENQLVKIWTNTSTALRKVALSQRTRDERDAGMADDEWLEAHPEYRPVVIVDNFLHKSNDGGADLVYDKLAEWAANLTTQNIAHVIFLTTDVSFSKSLAKALPDRPFRQMLLGDCSPEIAKQVVIRRINAENVAEPGGTALTPTQLRNDLDELDSVIQVLGGRLTDLEFLARRIQAGESPGTAVTGIIQQSASEILRMYLPAEERSWTPQQAWYLIKELAANEELKYNEILLNDLFSKNGDQALRILEQAELISIHSTIGRPNKISPGRPVFLSAFQFLVEDDVLRSRFDLSIVTQQIAKENATVDSCEKELHLLPELSTIPGELKPRIRYLLAKAATSQEKIVQLEAKAGKLKKVLSGKY